MFLNIFEMAIVQSNPYPVYTSQKENNYKILFWNNFVFILLLFLTFEVFKSLKRRNPVDIFNLLGQVHSSGLVG